MDELGTRLMPLKGSAMGGVEGAVVPEAGAVKAMDGDANFNRARNLLHLQCSGTRLTNESDDWLTEYMLSCPMPCINELHKIMDAYDDGTEELPL